MEQVLMIEAKGDLWKYPAEYRAVTTNGVVGYGDELVMGAGVALQAKKRFPTLPGKLGKWVKQYGNRAFVCPNYRIISFPTKHHWRNTSCSVLIAKSAREVAEIADKHNIQSVAMPRPGCGNGGLRWEDVRPLLADVLDDRFVVLTPSR
jgi:O-acetyl-ADP-ribose deacetylase (regulator of RNase III)